MLAVGREGHGRDPVRVALERLQRCTPMRLHSRLSFNPRGDTLLEVYSNNTLIWSKD